MKRYILNKLHRKLIAGSIKKKKVAVKSWNKQSSFEYGINRTEERKEKIILSMTTFTKRLPTVHICLKSLINQSVKADRIIVWLGPDVNPADITEKMKNLEQYGVEYRFVDTDLKPHKKYFYAMQEFSKSCVITVDDDVIYEKDMVKTLVNTHKKYPEAVCARRVHCIFLKDGKILPYNKWMQDCRRITKPSFRLVPTGVGGVLYPPNLFSNIAFDKEKIIGICFEADDIWLKFMELIHKVPVVWVKCLLTEPPVIRSAQKFALCNTNVVKSKNDIYIENMVKEYPEVIELLRK